MTFTNSQSMSNSNIKDISAQACICLVNSSPDSSNGGLITCLSAIENIGLAGSIASSFSSAARLTEAALEKACTPSSESLGNAIDSIARKNYAQLGFWLFVRVRYKEYVKGIFYQGWEEKFSSWRRWEHDGYDLKGNFQGAEDVTKVITKRAMAWRTKLFLQEKR